MSMAVIVRELIIKAVVDNRNDEMIPPVIKYEIIQEAVEQVMKIIHTNEDDIR